jgi:beta-catenin-like protein 1
LEEAEERIGELTPSVVREMLKVFQKKASKNQLLRAKFAEEPVKFMDSEIEIYGQMEELRILGASPEFHHILIELGTPSLILQLIGHENSDVCNGAVRLLNDLVDIDSSGPEKATELIGHYLAGGQDIFEVLMGALARLDKGDDAQAEGIYHVFGIFESFSTVAPSCVESVCKFPVMATLVAHLGNIGQPPDSVQLYASELLSIIAQAYALGCRGITTLEHGENGLLEGPTAVLPLIFSFRKNQKLSIDEQEYMHNLFDMLVAGLRDSNFKDAFLKAEGLELMLKCIKEKTYVGGCAIQVVTAALRNSPESARRLVDCGGLKHVFPMFVGRGYPKSYLRADEGGKKKVDEAVVESVFWICVSLRGQTERDYGVRVISKFVEGGCEKLDRCRELFTKYSTRVRKIDDRIRAVQQDTVALGPETEEYQIARDPEIVTMQRLEGGLELQQFSAAILATAVVYSTNTQATLSAVTQKLGMDGLSCKDLLWSLREAAGLLVGGEESDKDGEGGKDESIRAEARQKDALRANFVELSALLDAVHRVAQKAEE